MTRPERTQRPEPGRPVTMRPLWKASMRALEKRDDSVSEAGAQQQIMVDRFVSTKEVFSRELHLSADAGNGPGVQLPTRSPPLTYQPI